MDIASYVLLALACAVLCLVMWTFAARGVNKWGPDLTLELPFQLIQESLYAEENKSSRDRKVVSPTAPEYPDNWKSQYATKSKPPLPTKVAYRPTTAAEPSNAPSAPLLAVEKPKFRCKPRAPPPPPPYPTTVASAPTNSVASPLLTTIPVQIEHNYTTSERVAEFELAAKCSAVKPPVPRKPLVPNLIKQFQEVQQDTPPRTLNKPVVPKKPPVPSHKPPVLKDTVVKVLPDDALLQRRLKPTVHCFSKETKEV